MTRKPAPPHPATPQDAMIAMRAATITTVAVPPGVWFRLSGADFEVWHHAPEARNVTVYPDVGAIVLDSAGWAIRPVKTRREVR